MPVSELPPPAANRFNFNQGIGVLPQFRQPMIDPTDAGNPLNTDVGQMPAPPTMNYSPTPSNDWRGSAVPSYSLSPNYSAPGTPQGFDANARGNMPSWDRNNATYQGNPSQSLFAKLGGFLGDLFNNDPNSTPPSDTPPGMPQGQGYGAGGIPMKTWQEVFNTGRFTGAPAFSPTVAQAQFPGSRIGPQGGGTNAAANNRNAMGLGTPGFVGGYGGSLDSGTTAFQNYVSAHTKA